MKNKISRRMVKVTASVLIVMVLLCVWAPSANADESRICRKALSKCFVDAVIILIFVLSS